ncbi:thioesterase family protein [Nocardioides marmoraquaticus]
MTHAYFERLGDDRFRATEHVGGAWRTDEQHVAPSLGLLAHLVGRDAEHRRGADALVLGRASYDILGVMPVGEVEVSLEVLRPGRTIELVQATLSSGSRAAVVLRAWLLRPGDSAAVAGTPTAPLPPPADTGPWDPTTVWPGGFIASIELRREQVEPGRARIWVRTPLPLLAGEEVGPRARLCGLLDVANGMTVRADPRAVAFPNLDLTAHLHREPDLRDGWVGLDTSVTFGADGTGLTTSVVHDVVGPVGVSSQVLTVRP